MNRIHVLSFISIVLKPLIWQTGGVLLHNPVAIQSNSSDVSAEFPCNAYPTSQVNVAVAPNVVP